MRNAKNQRPATEAAPAPHPVPTPAPEAAPCPDPALEVLRNAAPAPELEAPNPFDPRVPSEPVFKPTTKSWGIPHASTYPQVEPAPTIKQMIYDGTPGWLPPQRDLVKRREQEAIDAAFRHFCISQPRWYDLSWDVFPIATCYREKNYYEYSLGYLDFIGMTICFIERFTQEGRITFLSLQEEVATIQAHESRGWLYIEDAVQQRQEIMDHYTKCLRAIRYQDSLELGPEFWGSIYYERPLW